MPRQRSGKSPKNKHSVNYGRARVRKEILVKQRRKLWTPEQVANLAGHFRLKPGSRLLDVGCGYGYVMRTWGRFCMPGGELVGLDRERNLLASATRYCRSDGLGGNARFVEADVYKMPFPDNTFDLTIAQTVLQHLAEPEKALDEMVRVTRPGGCVAVCDLAAGMTDPAWNTWCGLTIREQVLMHELLLRTIDGRRRLGFGDSFVGSLVPGWMGARRLEGVSVRANERVWWYAPPYRSPDLMESLRGMRAALKERGRQPIEKQVSAMQRAGGASARLVRAAERIGRRMGRRYRQALVSGTAAQNMAFPFWCIWGFKPRRSRRRRTKGEQST